MDLQSNKKLSALVVNIANPMQILASALTGEHLLSNGETLRLAGLIVLIYLGLIALSFPAAKVLRVKGSEAGLYRFMFIFSNTGFLGYPIVESLLGYQATFYVTLFVLFFQLFCWSYGASLIRGEARFRFQWQVLRQPCVAASLAALAIYLSGWQPPALLHQAVKYVGDITSPIVMLIVGCSARADALRADLRQLADLCADGPQNGPRAARGVFRAAARTDERLHVPRADGHFVHARRHQYHHPQLPVRGGRIRRLGRSFCQHTRVYADDPADDAASVRITVFHTPQRPLRRVFPPSYIRSVS